MRTSFRLLPLLLVTTACGKSQEMAKPVPEPMRTLDVEEPRTPPPLAMVAPSPPPGIVPAAGAPEPPDIAPRAAPGVAFNYRYAFRLPPKRIAQVQEEHAQACEKLGVARCRITGMLYRL